MAAAVRSGSSDLKIPEPTNTPSAPSCIISAASAGVAIPPAEKLTTGRPPFSATIRTSSSGAASCLAAVGSSVWSSAASRRISPRIERHDRDGAGGLRDPRLVGGDDVHDHAALQHLGQSGLHPEGGGLLHPKDVTRRCCDAI